MRNVRSARPAIKQAHSSLPISILFVKAMEGRLNESIVGEIRAAIRSKLSNRHVPAKIINCDKIPYTTNGKRLEVSPPPLDSPKSSPR